MGDMKKEISSLREEAEKDPAHRKLLTDAADRLEKVYKKRLREMQKLPKVSEAKKAEAIERGWRYKK